MFIVQQASIRHRYGMPFAAFFSGTIMPLLLMLSPLAVMAAALTAPSDHIPRTCHHPPLM
ncbi:hypothetical protein [Sphingobium sp. Z007]|uniref:hypothetical protein n=1 Tax=Sphingobium sp. Z007 TaxID=627495 RepID=UPI001124E502|nr:hypothetical protein [Sphingobium sp. Z007]